jgi:hypothetical protein
VCQLIERRKRGGIPVSLICRLTRERHERMKRKFNLPFDENLVALWLTQSSEQNLSSRNETNFETLFKIDLTFIRFFSLSQRHELKLHSGKSNKRIDFDQKLFYYINIFVSKTPRPTFFRAFKTGMQNGFWNVVQNIIRTFFFDKNFL